MGDNISKRNLRKTIIFALLPLIFFTFAVEIVCRIITFNRFSPYQTNIEIQGEGRFSNDSTMIWGNSPYYLEYDKRYQYDEFGIKSEPGEIKMPKKKENELRVFLFGGSTMAGKGSQRGLGFLKITGVTEHKTADTIEQHLQEQLQKSFSDKKVKVFNASVAMHSVAQSSANYERLKHLKPDWVISMDGNNQKIPDQYESDIDYRRNYWPTTKINIFPIKQLRMIAKHSAFVYLVGEYLYYKSGMLEAPLNEPPDPKEKAFWLSRPKESPTVTPEKLKLASRKTKVSFKGFIRDLSVFHDKLENDGQKHLLLVQPLLKMRNLSKMPEVERSAFNLLESITATEGEIGYERYLYSLLPENLPVSKNIFSMAAVHDWEGWVFVDHCHVTKETNKRIAKEIARFIETGGSYQPFPVSSASKPL
jgi:hypothetical protein